MKAKDITVPGEYEVKHWSGAKRATIVLVEKVEKRVFGSDRYDSMNGHMATVWQAKDDEGTAYPLAAVLRPWAEAAPEHAEREEFEARKKAVGERLTAANLGFVDTSREGGLYPVTVRLTIEQAEALATRLGA
jgi:hypothetical protein